MSNLIKGDFKKKEEPPKSYSQEDFDNLFLDYEQPYSLIKTLGLCIVLGALLTLILLGVLP